MVLVEDVEQFYYSLVEDPVDEYVRLRDYVDVMKCRSLPAFKTENLRNGFSKEMINEARKHRKINQVCRSVDSLSHCAPNFSCISVLTRHWQLEPV